MEPTQRRCCGIDVHKKKLMAHVLPPQGQMVETKPLEREFRTFTRELRRLRDWLKECGVSEVVMEATGQYWRPVWNVLEQHIPSVMLVNPQHVKALAGRKRIVTPGVPLFFARKAIESHAIFTDVKMRIESDLFACFV